MKKSEERLRQDRCTPWLREHHVKRKFVPLKPQDSSNDLESLATIVPCKVPDLSKYRDSLHPHKLAIRCRVPRGFWLCWSPAGSHGPGAERGKCNSELQGKLSPLGQNSSRTLLDIFTAFVACTDWVKFFTSAPFNFNPSGSSF